MGLKAQGSKFKGEKKQAMVRPAVAAVVLTAILHGAAFSVPAYLYYKSKVKSEKSKVVKQHKTDMFIDVAVLPDTKEKGEKSIIKEAEGKKPEAAPQDDGIAGQAAKQGGEQAEKEMLTYQDIIKQRIQQARKYPADARKNGIEGGVEMAFTVMKQGGLKDVQITGASGHALLDEEALATIRRASPFPEMPAGYAGQEMTMRVKIIFNIE
jgi:protein TonB